MTAHTFLIAILILGVVCLVLAVGCAGAGVLVRTFVAGGYAPNWIKASALGMLFGMALPLFLMLCFAAVLACWDHPQFGWIADWLSYIVVAGGPALFGLCLLTTPIVAFTAAYLYTQPVRKK